jgi:hypothetical protein
MRAYHPSKHIRHQDRTVASRDIKTPCSSHISCSRETLTRHESGLLSTFGGDSNHTCTRLHTRSQANGLARIKVLKSYLDLLDRNMSRWIPGTLVVCGSGRSIEVLLDRGPWRLPIVGDECFLQCELWPCASDCGGRRDTDPLIQKLLPW